MEVQVAESGPCRKTLNIKVPVESIKAQIDEAYNTASQQAQVKGFRPGKVPRKILQQRYGEAIMAEAKEQIINSSFESAIRDHEIRFVGQPNLEGISEEPLKEDEALSFSVHVDVAPTIELGTVKGIEITAEDPAVTDEDIDNGLQQLADSKKKLQTVEDGAADGDFVKGNLTFSKDGKTVLERKSVQLHTSIPVAGTDAQVFSDKLRGCEAKSKLEIELTYPETFEKEEVRGEKGMVEIEVLEVLRMVAPPIDDALAKDFDHESLDSLKTQLRRRIGEEKENNEKARQEGQVLEALLAEYQFAVPQGLVADQKKHMLSQLGQDLQQRGATEDQVKEELARHEKEATDEAERRVRVYFLLDSVAKQEKIFVTEGDVDVEFRNIAAKNQAAVEQVREYYESQNMLSDLRLGIMERKVREFLRENAKITDK